MVGTRGTVVKDSTAAQISAAIYYQSQVIARLMNNKRFQESFKKTIYFQVEKDFGEYIDALARVKPKSLHHVYEWNKAGNKNARLFKLKKLASTGISLRLDYEFKQSKSMVPSKGKKTRKHVFADKARVMEEGKPLTIRPRFAERLVFEVDGVVTFMPKGMPVVVRRPGGAASTNQFDLNYNRFFSTNLVSLSIKRSGFQQLFNTAMVKSMKLPADIKKVKYSFSANSLVSQADNSIDMAFGALS